jgi:hypothetical protein
VNNKFAYNLRITDWSEVKINDNEKEFPDWRLLFVLEKSNRRADVLAV